MEPHPSWLVPVGIAIGTAVIVPAAVWTARKVAEAWHRHRVEILGEVFITREEVQRQLRALTETQARQHQENHELLESLRLDGKEREGRLSGMLDSMRGSLKDEVKEVRESVGKVHGRVDSVLAMLGNRRRQ